MITMLIFIGVLVLLNLLLHVLYSAKLDRIEDSTLHARLQNDRLLEKVTRPIPDSMIAHTPRFKKKMNKLRKIQNQIFLMTGGQYMP